MALARHVTPEEYLRRERASEGRHEYLGGEVFAMSGASRRHNLVGGNTFASLHGQLRQGDCQVYQSDMRVKVSATGLYTYPDVVVVCGEPRFEDQSFDTLLNPTVIIEVLSPTTENYDRGKKFEHYRSISSLQAYVLVAQDRLYVEAFTRVGEGERWLLNTGSTTEAVIELAAIGCVLRLSEMYEKVTFEEQG